MTWMIRHLYLIQFVTKPEHDTLLLTLRTVGFFPFLAITVSHPIDKIFPGYLQNMVQHFDFFL